MPLKITVMGIQGDRVTLGISATFQGSEIKFDRNTFSVETGAELNFIMSARLQSGGIQTEAGELIPAETEIAHQSLYKIEPNNN